MGPSVALYDRPVTETGRLGWMFRRTRFRSLTIALVLALGVALSFSQGSVRGQDRSGDQTGRRVVMLGFDGAAAQITERMLGEGKLPHLAALRERGGYSRLATANPAQSPVSWASMTTGLNPGETGIYDFLKRRFTPGEPGVGIAIGMVEPVAEVVLSPVQRAAIVTLAGVLGAALGGLLAWFGLGAISAGWRRGGRLQAALCAPAALLSVVALVVVGWVPETVPFAKNLRGGEPFWVTIDRAGLVCEALEAPLAFPADPMEHGACLSGLGVPDLQGTWGTWSVWTDDLAVPATTETAGSGYFVGTDVDEFEIVLAGPLDPRPGADEVIATTRKADEEKYRRELAFDWGRARRRQSETEEALLRIQRRLTTNVHVALLRDPRRARLTTAEEVVVDLVPGEWSDPVPVVFPVSPLARFTPRGRLSGRVRFLLSFGGETPGAEATRGTFRIFVAPVNIDPTADLPPNLRISEPPEFVRDLAAEVGPFETLGWPELTNPVKDNLLADVFFLEHIKRVMAGREARLKARIAAGGWDCLFAMFSETDRVQHVLWRHTDPKSPTYDPDVSPQFADAIENIYMEMDRIVGETVAAVGPDVQVLVVSDHGFAPFRRGVNINNFLRAEGLQVGIPGAQGGPMSVAALATRGSTYFSDVDWSRTRAYAMGLGNIFLNLKGREPGGIVDPADAPALIEEIREKLLALRDTDGFAVTREVYRGSDLYHGARVAEAPDLVAGFEEGYRVSWQNCLGALDSDVITDNTQLWSADHCSVDPSIVPGILFSSRPLRADAEPGILDVVPSLFELLGMRRDHLEGTSFFADE